MDDLKTLGELLRLPELEGETVSLINKKMREMINQIVVLTPEQRAIQDEINMKNVGSIMKEWLEGQKEGDSNGSS